MEKKKKIVGLVFKFIIIMIALVGILGILKLAPNYKNNDIKDKINLVINNSNVTGSLKKDVYMDEKGIVYLSFDDIDNFFDRFLYHDEQYHQIVTTSGSKIASIEIGKNEMYINSSKTQIYGTVIEKEGEFYLPFSEMGNVYNVKTTYVQDTNTVIIESLDRKLTKAIADKDLSIKMKDTTLSRTVAKVKRGDSVIIVAEEQEGWTKVRTETGKIGYVKTKRLSNIKNVREDMEYNKQITGKVNIVWDYFSEYASAPDRQGQTIEGINVVSPAFFALTKSGKGELETNIGTKGKAYIEWAKGNGYKVWPMVSNNSLKETTAEIMRDYKLREKLINAIVEQVVEYGLDGVNIDFENMYAEDKELFSRFIIELEPRLKEIGAVLSVDVTAPDGGETWSLCYNRNVLGYVADYLIFMAYDQHGISSTEAGSVAAHDWVEANIKKFLGQEGVKPEKIILGIPLYTRLWKEKNGELTSSVKSMNDIDTVLPNNVERKWDEDAKQYYAEYEKNGAIYKMWLEEKDSIRAKLELIQQYQLAGSAFWEKDRENPEIWTILKEMTNP